MKLLFTCLTILFVLTAYAQSEFYSNLADSAESIIDPSIRYDARYVRLDYPNGDVPKSTGVCTDVVIRTYRKFGIDLQKEVHEDMRKNFGLYPKHWNLSRPDRNIDHRRVPNLTTFFKRKGKTLKIDKNPENYQPGDIVCWNLGGSVTHIGIVSNKKSRNSKIYLMIHNIGGGQVAEDMLFDHKIIGHYRYKK